MKTIKYLLTIVFIISVSFSQNSVITIGGSGTTTTSAHITIGTDGYKCPDEYVIEGGATLTTWDPSAICSATGVAPEMDLKQLTTAIPDGGGHDFGSKSLGSNEFRTFTIENTGTADLTITTPLSIGGTDASQFHISAQPSSSTISPGGTTTFQVRFTPTTGGAKTATIAIANNDSDENPYDLTITGMGLEEEMDLKQGTTAIPDGGSYDYGNHTIGTNTDVIFTIENPGTDDLNFTGPFTISGTDASEFNMQVDPVSPVVANGGTNTYTIRFNPTSLGAKTALFSTQNSDLDENPYDLVLNGNSIPRNVMISGHVTYSNNDPVDDVDVTFSNGGGTVTTDANGYYERFITEGWSGTGIPTKIDHSFNPTSYIYTTILTNQYNKDYVATRNSLKISGYVRDNDNNGLEGFEVEFSNGGATVITNATGHYNTSVAYGWDGTAAPTKDGWLCTPVSYTYPTVTSDQTDKDYVSTDLTLAINEHLSSLPTEFTILSAYPNPFNPSTTIRYGLDIDSHVTVEIYDISGMLIATLINTEQALGWHSIIWNGTNQQGKRVPAGLYFNKITSDNEVKTAKLMLLK